MQSVYAARPRCASLEDSRHSPSPSAATLAAAAAADEEEEEQEEEEDEEEVEEEASDSRRRADRTMSTTDGLKMLKSVEWSRALRRPENFFIAL